MFRLNFFATYFAWIWWFQIFEWFSAIEQHIKSSGSYDWWKIFHKKVKGLMLMAKCVRKYNTYMILWFDCYAPNREMINYSCFPQTVFARYFAKTLCENFTQASLIKKERLNEKYLMSNKSQTKDLRTNFRYFDLYLLFNVLLLVVLFTRTNIKLPSWSIFCRL